MPEVFDNIGIFISSAYFSFTGTETRARLTDCFTDNSPTISKYDESTHWTVFEHFHICAFFWCNLYLK